MSHNESQRALRDSILATPIGRYSGYVLVLTCPSCRDGRELLIRPLIEAGRGEDTVERLLMRLRCRACGALPDTVKLQPRPGLVPRSKQILLVGPGAR